MASNSFDPPETTKGDVAYTIAKAGLSAIPMVGGPALELFQYLIQAPLERRRSEWMMMVGEKLQDLEGRGVNIEELGQKEEFVSAVMHASQIALRTHQAEKKEALRNAVLNIAMAQSPGEALEHMFLEWIDSLSGLHLQILKLFQSPSFPSEVSAASLSSVLEHHMPYLRGHGHVYNQVWKDLYSRGLVNTEGMLTTMTSQGLLAKRTTEIGDTFLRFISEPT